MILKDYHLHIFCDIFTIIKNLYKKFIYRKPIQVLRRIAILFIEYNIEIQMHWISTNQNFLADILSHSKYTKITNKQSSL